MERAVLPPLLIFIFLLPLSVPAGALLCCTRPESSDQTSPGKKQPFLVIRVPNWLPGGSSRIRFSLPLGSSHDSYWGFSHGCPTRAKQQDSPISERAAVQRRSGTWSEQGACFPGEGLHGSSGITELRQRFGRTVDTCLYKTQPCKAAARPGVVLARKVSRSCACASRS